MQNLEKLSTLVQFIDTSLIGVAMTSKSGREKIALSLLDLTHYHVTGLTTLLEQKIQPPAFALARTVLESLVRGLWILDCATDCQVDTFRKKDIILDEKKRKIDFKDLAKAVEEHRNRPNTLTSFLKESWGTLNSFTHNGLAQIYDHWGANTMEPKFTDEQIDQIIHLAGRCDSLAFAVLLEATDRQNKEEVFVKLVELTNGWLK